METQKHSQEPIVEPGLSVQVSGLSRDSTGNPHRFDYSVRKYTDIPDRFEATTPYRQVVWQGDTEAEAIGAMLKGVAELARRGSIDPDAPYRIGVPTLQHVMAILTESLEWHLERRREQIELENQHATERPDSNDVDYPEGAKRLNRLNEIISGLATSIAALARVKEL